MMSAEGAEARCEADHLERTGKSAYTEEKSNPEGSGCHLNAIAAQNQYSIIQSCLLRVLFDPMEPAHRLKWLLLSSNF